MDQFLYNKMLNNTIYTGSPWEVQQKRAAGQINAEEDGQSFKEILKGRIEKDSQLVFTKHAMDRVISRNVNVSGPNMERLNEGLKLAVEKGLSDPLILVGSTAFVVNVKNNKVITVVNQENLKGTVFTNIDGTVLV
ncbi:TIGR02530 family flagellar biosynthesis protein [Robinsoniella peoriensis]|uniref:TIGR02530 family flagellar biosynthesis protein n=1 Tax=Robinsoniella peoriensis TaxID=180332 RepID=UPI00085BB71B|nr:TIGR02530 family flagellar biosynthesis protein [Robinsoniella peoriensis]